MSISSPFIHRPVATTLLTIALGLSGALAFFFLPVSPLPQVEYPSISVNATLPGASPETMASAVATPLERQFGRIAGINEMTSSSGLGSTSITMVFDLNRNIDAAARDVQAAINAARSQLPANLPGNPTYRKVNPSDAPIMILTLTSDTNDKPAISMIIFRQPGANIIATVDRIRALMPQMQAEIPAAMKLDVALDRTTTIRASVRDVEITLAFSITLVILVVFLFLRDFRT